MYEEPKMEKLTINLPPVEIARIDILVEAGYYPSRAEFIRAAIRQTLDTHQDFVAKKLDTIVAPSDDSDGGRIDSIAGIGISHLSRAAFERAIAQGKKMRIVVVGMLHLDQDVTPDHVTQAVESARVYGVIRASAAVKAALQRQRKERRDA